MNIATTIGSVTPARAMPTVPGDRTILDAFAARRRDFEATYDTDMTQEEEDGYFSRLDACETVICDTPATTIAGIIAKLRIAFMHQDGSAWADRAIMDPTHPDFVAGLAASDMYTRMKWGAIECLAQIGGVDLVAQGRDPQPEPGEWESLCARFCEAQAEQVRAFEIDFDSPRADAAEAACTAALLTIKDYPVTSLAMLVEKVDLLVAGFGVLESHDMPVLIGDMRRVVVAEGR